MVASLQVDIPQELANRLRPFKSQLPRIIELGLQEWNAAGQSGFEGAPEVLEFLAKLPSPDEIIALRPSEALQSSDQILPLTAVGRVTVRLLQLNAPERVEERRLLILSGVWAISAMA